MTIEIEAIVIQAAENSYMAICNQYPGLTGEGPTKDDAIANLSQNIEAYLVQKEGQS